MKPGRLASFIILLCAAIATAQDRQCTLKLAQLPDVPEFFGFRVGMTKDQVKARIPHITVRLELFNIERRTKMLKEFRDFIARGNVIDLAVAVIIGAAFGKLVTSLVEGIIMPPIGMVLGGVDFSNLFI